MKPVVDHDLCIGCGACEDVCEDVFQLKEDGLSYVINENPGEELYGCTRDAADSCPVDAITIEE
jgi:ferredoxin